MPKLLLRLLFRNCYLRLGTLSLRSNLHTIYYDRQWVNVISRVGFVFGLVILCYHDLTAQIGLGTASPHPKAQFDITSTTRGVLFPRMSAIQRLAIAPDAAAQGLLVYDTDSLQYMVWTGSLWEKMGGSAGASNWQRSGVHIYNDNPGRVGIGVSNPLAKLHVGDSAVVFTKAITGPIAASASVPVDGAGIRMMWVPERAAFRVGAVDDGQLLGIIPLYTTDAWSGPNLGKFSFAAGYNTSASNDYSVALGFRASASGEASFALGNGVQSSGPYSFAMGLECVSSNVASLAAGFSSTASGNSSVALGTFATSSGSASFAMGLFARATADNSVAFGSNAEATGTSAFAFGEEAQATSPFALAAGNDAQATGSHSIALGNGSRASAQHGLAIGQNAQVSLGISAIAIGRAANSRGNDALAIGRDAAAWFDDGLALGNGAQSMNRYAFAIGTGAQATGEYGVAIGQQSVAAGINSTALGFNTQSLSVQSSALGTGLVAKAFGGTAVGSYNNNNDFLSFSPLQQDRIFQVGNGVNNIARSNALTLFRNGNLGLGTVFPEAIIHLNQAEPQKVIFAERGSNSYFGVGIESTGAQSVLHLHAPFSQHLSLTTAERITATLTSRLFVDGNSGNIGIGTTIPTAAVQIQSSVANKLQLADEFGQTAGFSVTNSVNLYAGSKDIRLGNGDWATESPQLVIRNTGQVGIGVPFPNAPLQFTNDIVNRKIVLYENANNEHQYYGFGINGGTLRYQTDDLFADHVFFSAVNSFSSAELMRIKGNGMVGVGASDPVYRLDVNGRMRIRSGGSNASSAGIWFNNNSNNASPAFVGMESDGAVGFFGSGTPNGWGLVMNIASGNVGIGTSSPTQKLHVIGNILATGTITPSDIRYKHNIKPIENALVKLGQLNGVSYNMHRGLDSVWMFDSTRQMGFIAQEVERVFPELVHVISTSGYKGVDYVKLIPVLTEGVKALAQQQEALALAQQKLDAAWHRLEQQQEMLDQRIRHFEQRVMPPLPENEKEQ